MKLMTLDEIEPRIRDVRGHRVILSTELAELYGVELRALTQAVRRNPKRFPHDFMFQLTSGEVANLKSQFVISSFGHGGSRHPPLAFTEQGVGMLSSVLNSARAVAVNVFIMRAFVAVRQHVIGNADLAREIAEMKKLYEGRFARVFRVLEDLSARPTPPRRRIGFS